MFYNCFLYETISTNEKKNVLCSHRFREFHECQWFIGIDCFLSSAALFVHMICTHTHTNAHYKFSFVLVHSTARFLLLFFFILRHCLAFYNVLSFCAIRKRDLFILMLTGSKKSQLLAENWMETRAKNVCGSFLCTLCHLQVCATQSHTPSQVLSLRRMIVRGGSFNFIWKWNHLRLFYYNIYLLYGAFALIFFSILYSIQVMLLFGFSRSYRLYSSCVQQQQQHHKKRCEIKWNWLRVLKMLIAWNDHEA